MTNLTDAVYSADEPPADWTAVPSGVIDAYLSLSSGAVLDAARAEARRRWGGAE
jgi:hypothetical protein